MKIENKLTERNPSDIMSAINSKLEISECKDIGSKDKVGGKIDFSIIGKRFGMLVVVSYSYVNKKISYWKCLCDCGGEKIVSRSCLNTGTKSCGCLSTGKSYKRKHCHYENLTGIRFNKLLVIKEIGINRSGVSLWQCQCDCGNSVERSSASLKRKKKGSCGCLARKGRIGENLIGQRFGSLIVIKNIIIKCQEGYQTRWSCRCDCGFVKTYTSEGLRQKGSESGCSKCGNYFRGSAHHGWNPNLTKEDREENRFNDPAYKRWRKVILERDSYTCQITGHKGNICVHHLESWHINKDLRLDLNNGITILESVHMAFHNIYGRKNNTRVQFEEFKANLSNKDIEYLIERN